MSDYLIDLDTGCSVWQRARTTAGYGTLTPDGKTRYAHRVFYEGYVADVPQGFDLDHLCRNPACGNPDHLQPVTHAENMRRARRSTKRETLTLLPPVVPSIPFGKCQCGCGAETNIAKKTITAKGIFKGQPYRYLRGHAGSWWEQGGYAIDPRTGCWIFQIDHICSNKLCVKPDHLHAVTALERVRRTGRKRYEN
jgi:hypothetical protein